MPKRKLRQHQLDALAFIRARRGQAGLFMRPGTMKTLIAIRYTNKPHRLPCLVLCRRDDYQTWQDELEQEGAEYIATQSGNHFAMGHQYTLLTYGMLRGEPKNRRPPYKGSDYGKWMIHQVRMAGFRSVIADECHYLKNPSAARTEAALEATRDIPIRLGLTGTHQGNSLEDPFGQALWIDNGGTFGQSIWEFRKRYFLKAQGAHGWFPRRTAKDDIAKRLTKLAFVAHEDDVLDLPPVVRVTKCVPMDNRQRTVSSDLLEEWEYEVTKGGKSYIVEVNEIMTRLAKLRQAASGFIYDEDGHPEWFSTSPKLGWLIDALSKGYLAHKPKVVVWCAFTAEVEKLERELEAAGISTVTFYGGMTPNGRNEARKAFKNNKGVRVFIGQAESGIGMNELAVADTAVYFSNSEKVIAREQNEGRIRREGSQVHQTITYVDLVSEDSIEIKALKALRKKRNLADVVSDLIKQGQGADFLRNLRVDVIPF